MHLTQHHHGGFQCRVMRSERDLVIREIASQAAKVIVVAESALAATLLGQRLTLRGLPVRMWQHHRDGSVSAFLEDDFGALVTHRQHTQPVPWTPTDAPTAVVHVGTQSNRSYQSLLQTLLAPVHITLVDQNEPPSKAPDLTSAKPRPQADVLSEALTRATVAVDQPSQRRRRLLSS